MNILVLGSRGAGIGCHFPERFSQLLKDRFEKVVFYDPMDLPHKQEHISEGLRYKLSEVVKLLGWIPDLIFISECLFYWKNDIRNICHVWYLHNESYRPLTVSYPDVIFFWSDNVLLYFKKLFAKRQMSKIKHQLIMPPAINKTVYKPREKIYSGIRGIGFRTNESNWEKRIELPSKLGTICILKEIELFKEMGFRHFDSPIDDIMYRLLISQCEMFWFSLSPNQWISRRILGAMACKTLVIFNIESEKHEKYLESQGLFKSVHYIGINSVEDMKDFDINKFSKYKKTDIIRRAHRVVMKKHTYECRVNTVLELYEEITKK